MLINRQVSLYRSEKELLRNIAATIICSIKAKNPEFKKLWESNYKYLCHNLERLLPNNTTVYIKHQRGVVTVGLKTEGEHNGSIHNLFNGN